MRRNLAFIRLDCDYYFGKMAKSPDISDVRCVLYVKDCHQDLEGHRIVVSLSNIKASTRISTYSLYKKYLTSLPVFLTMDAWDGSAIAFPHNSHVNDEVLEKPLGDGRKLHCNHTRIGY